MHTINLLDTKVINKIAAGEVIERPSSIVKELVENSIDARASAISVEIKEGGKKLIRVTDNGIGIPKTEVKKAFLRHATSKILNDEDLNRILSLGFRGEALSSIVAVSELEIITKTLEDTTAKRMIIAGGDVKLDEEVGAPEGTTILVNNLFYNVPARRKFLKKDQVEAAEISDIITKLSLAHPGISFKFINQGKLVFHTSGNSDLLNCIFNVYGKEVAKEVLEVEFSDLDIKVKGYIGKTTLLRASRSYENFFVNGRFIKSRFLEDAMTDAYYGYVMKGKFPFCVLHIDITPELIDVNVHPNKTEIRFKDESEVYNYLTENIKSILRGLDHSVAAGLVPIEKESTVFSTEALKEPYEYENKYAKEEIEKELESGDVEKEEVKRNSPAYKNERINFDEGKGETPEFREDEALYKPNEKDKSPEFKEETYEEVKLNAMPIRDYRIIGQVFKTYWLIEQNEELYIIDQHAAHEKVLYERLKAAYRQKDININSQILLEPIIVDLQPKELLALEENLEVFKRYGFDLYEFGPNSYAIRAVPFVFDKLMTREVFLEIIDELMSSTAKRDAEALDDMFAMVSCKRAVKANERQSEKEAVSLINDLMTLENPFNCPHGRPVIIDLSKYEIEKKFKRIV